MKFFRKYSFVMLVLGALLCAVVSGCNARKRNTAAARQYTAFITKYNIHYNGDKHYRETLDEMEKTYEDDYTGLVLTHPAEAKGNEKAPQPTGDFTRSIEKAQKAIQLRSITKKPARKRGKSKDPKYKEWMKREEYNPFLHNDWLMMGRSQYMNGDFLGASATFFYTGRHFSWLPVTVTESKLWQARSYLAMDWLYEAEQILIRVKKEELTNKTLQYLYDLDWAMLHIRQHQYAEASPFLEAASRHGSAAQKTRLTFLLGQVYERAGDKAKAYKAFGRAASASSAPYRTQFNARIRQSEVFTGPDIESEVQALRRMTRYDRNKDFLDQIYYAIGNLYLSRGDTVKAIRNYEEGAAKSTRNGIEKAILNVRLGGLFYDEGRYEKAQPCYAEAVPMLPKDYPGLDTLKKRSDVLDELATYSQNVTEQDSLLKLAAMDSTARMDVINAAIDNLKVRERKEAEEAAREAYMAEQKANGSSQGNASSAPQQFQMNNDNSWYFYNQSARTAGRTEFQRRWGSRKLEDNWRRRNKSSFNTADFDAPSGENEEGESAEGTENTEETRESKEDQERKKREDDPHYPEYYLKQIPFTAEQKATANDVIQEGLYNMGVILKDKMDDYPAAQTQFDRLLTDYPDNVFRLDTYFNLYLMYMRTGDTALANRYRSMVLSQFPESKEAMALRDPDYIDNLRKMDREENLLYEQAYEAYMNNDNRSVHRIYADVSERYSMSKLMPKFMFLEALAYVTDKEPEKFNATLRTLLERYPDTDLTPTVSAWLAGMARGRKLQSGGTGANMRGMVWDISLGADSTAQANQGQGVQFEEISPDARQLLVLSFPTDAVSANELLYNVARHNFSSFVVKDYDLEYLNFGRLGMIVIRSFDNMDELNHYRKVMARSDRFKLPAGVRPIVISEANFDALLKSGASLDDYFRFLDEQNYIDAQKDLLPYTEIETLPEADARAAEEAAPQQPSEESAEQSEATPEPAAPTKPEAEPVKPEQPAPAKPATKTTATPAKPEKPAAKPAKPAQKPATQPAKPTPPPVTRPQYDPGSEGDDETDEP
ncbi:MAG: tetratricopeptide repeat protein [Muribaculaceae bacterium]